MTQVVQLDTSSIDVAEFSSLVLLVRRSQVLSIFLVTVCAFVFENEKTRFYLFNLVDLYFNLEMGEQESCSNLSFTQTDNECNTNHIFCANRHSAPLSGPNADKNKTRGTDNPRQGTPVGNASKSCPTADNPQQINLHIRASQAGNGSTPCTGINIILSTASQGENCLENDKKPPPQIHEIQPADSKSINQVEDVETVQATDDAAKPPENRPGRQPLCSGSDRRRRPRHSTPLGLSSPAVPTVGAAQNWPDTPPILLSQQTTLGTLRQIQAASDAPLYSAHRTRLSALMGVEGMSRCETNCGSRDLLMALLRGSEKVHHAASGSHDNLLIGPLLSKRVANGPENEGSEVQVSSAAEMNQSSNSICVLENQLLLCDLHRHEWDSSQPDPSVLKLTAQTLEDGRFQHAATIQQPLPVEMTSDMMFQQMMEPNDGNEGADVPGRPCAPRKMEGLPGDLSMNR